MDDYLQFVVHLLDDSEYNQFNSQAVKKENDLNFGEEFFASQDFHARDRTYSWDLPFDDASRKRSNSMIEFALSCFDQPIHEQQQQQQQQQQHQQQFQFNQQPPFKKQNMRMDLRDPVATVQLESGSGATTVMPVFNSPDCCCDSMNVKIGAYTKEERQILIEKFRAKKKRRVWRKQIKYDCRKRLADTRPRVKGRFVSRKEKDGNSDGDSESMNNVEAEIDMGVYDDTSVESSSSS